MIPTLIGRLSARASGVCPFRESKESSSICGTSPGDVQTSELAFPLKVSVGSGVSHGCVSTGKPGSVEIKCLTVPRVNYGVQQLECKVIESHTDIVLSVKVHCAQKCVLIL